MNVVVVFCMSRKGDNRRENWGFSNTVGVDEVRFPRFALGHGNMWSGKREDERVGYKELLTPGWPHGYPWYEMAVVL